MDPLSIAREAADKDFKWWFLMLLALMLMTALWCFRYLLQKSENDRKAYENTVAALMSQNSESRERHASRIEALQAEVFKISRDMIVALTGCEKVIESNTKESEKVRNVIEDMNEHHHT